MNSASEAIALGHFTDMPAIISISGEGSRQLQGNSSKMAKTCLRGSVWSSVTDQSFCL